MLQKDPKSKSGSRDSTPMREERSERRLHPRLRVIRNGDQFVNAIRSDAATTVACALSTSRDGVPPAPALAAASETDLAALRGIAEAPRSRKLPKRAKMEEQPKAASAYVNVLIELQPERSGTPAEEQAAAVTRLNETLERAVPQIERSAVAAGISRRRNFVAATVPISLLDELERDPAVAFVHAAEPLKLDAPPTSPARTAVKKAIGNPSTHGRGKGVLIGIIDVGGFDFAHPDFLDDKGETRFVAIWDQRVRPPAASQARGFDYGSEFTKAHMDAAIAASAEARCAAATLLERQSQTSPGSHGTHVASIAAGNTGVCPEASIAGVLIDVPLPDDPIERRRTTFSDTSRIIHAVEYLLRGRIRDEHAAGRERQPRHQRRRARRIGRCLAVARRLSRSAGTSHLRRGGQRRPGQSPDRGRPRLDHGPHPRAGARARTRSRGGARMDGRRRRHRGPIRKRARDLVQARRIGSASPSSRPGAATGSRSTLASSWRTIDCRAVRRCRSTTSCITRQTAPTTSRLYLSPNLDAAQFSRHRRRRVEGPAHRRGGSRRPLQRLDRTRRSRGARAGRRPPCLSLSVVLHRAKPHRLAFDQLAGVRSSRHRGVKSGRCATADQCEQQPGTDPRWTLQARDCRARHRTSWPPTALPIPTSPGSR